MDPKVTILTPAFNAAPYLAATIESVLAQTMSSFEMIVVDDGSGDDTAGIAEHFARREPRIRVIRQPNAGVAAARNVAIADGRGDCFALLDSDDRWMPSYLDTQLRILAEQPSVDIVSCNALNDGGDWDARPLRPASGPVRPIPLLEMIEVEDSVSVMAVFRRRVVERVGMFNPRLRGNEDYEYWLRAAAADLIVAFNPTPLAYYRRRADSMSANERGMLTGIIRVLTAMRSLCQGRPLELAAINRQIGHFERRRLTIVAKEAFLANQYDAAASAFDELGVRFGAPYRLLSAVCRTAPRGIRVGYAFKRTAGQLSRQFGQLKVRVSTR